MIQPKVSRRIYDRAMASNTQFDEVSPDQVKEQGMLGLSHLSLDGGVGVDGVRDVIVRRVFDEHTKLEKRKTVLKSSLENLKEANRLELRHARREGIIVLGTAIITGVCTAGAITLSNALGALTTLTAGGSGTSILYYSSETLRSYSSLKTELEQKGIHLKDRIERCKKEVSPNEEEDTLEKVEADINQLYKDLYSGGQG